MAAKYVILATKDLSGSFVRLESALRVLALLLALLVDVNRLYVCQSNVKPFNIKLHIYMYTYEARMPGHERCKNEVISVSEAVSLGDVRLVIPMLHVKGIWRTVTHAGSSVGTVDPAVRPFYVATVSRSNSLYVCVLCLDRCL